MKEVFLKGYYGYKNFGDELLLFGVVKRIFSEYPQINHLVIEVNNKIRIEYRVKKNYHDYLSKEQYSRISFVEIKQHRRKRFTHLLSMLGFAKYRNYFKFFGGGEVLSDERGFPHDGRNILLLFAPIIRKGKFILLGGIGTPKRREQNCFMISSFLEPKQLSPEILLPTKQPSNEIRLLPFTKILAKKLSKTLLVTSKP
jgi:polysaccharide pyruvyl transferase WcaK-like protein